VAKHPGLPYPSIRSGVAATEFVDSLAVFALAAWLGVLLLPSGAWRTRERLEVTTDPAEGGGTADLRHVTVLIPARNEAEAIGITLRGLAAQGQGLEVLVIDDQSDDGTAAAAHAANAAFAAPLDLRVISGAELPAGWGGKLWALEQGFREADRPVCLLLDAEIELAPGVVPALLDKLDSDGRAMVSVMAELECASFWEKLLVPPFIFFFKLIYPFAKVNNPRRSTAAAAGGCILLRRDVLAGIGGFAAIRDALIDDCTLASRVKRAGHSIWLGLSRSVQSRRRYPDLASFRRMVTRTAFTQLRYSLGLLLLVVALMLAVFVAPLAAVIGSADFGRAAGAGALAAMAVSYWPTVRFYRLSPGWIATLPVAATLFLAMTIESALNYWFGVRAVWKGRSYRAD